MELRRLECSVNFRREEGRRRVCWVRKDGNRLLFDHEVKNHFLDVKEANDRQKRNILKALILSLKVDIVCLQVTKIHIMSVEIVRSLRVGRFLEWGVVESRRACWWC